MKKDLKIDKSLRKPLISGDDHIFLIILLVSAVIHISMAGYLNTIEIKRVKEVTDVIKEISPRFAKLLLQSPKERARARMTWQPKKEAVKKEEPVLARKEPIPAVKESRPQTVEERRMAVRQKGLLGVITAKKRPMELPGKAVFQQVDELIKGLKKGGKEETDILAKLDIKGIELTGDVAGKTASVPREAGVKDVGEILKEKKEFLPKEDEKGKGKTALAVSKRRDEEDIYRTILKYSGGLKYIYNNALRNDPSLKGKVTVRIVIAPDGKVVKAEIASSTLNSQDVEEAMLKRIFKWQFTEAKGGEDFTIDYTFDFSPVS